MSQKSINVIASIVKWGIFILPVSVLVVAGSFTANRDLGTFVSTILLPGVGDLFFPFITGKNFFFRIFIEILFGLWVFAAVFDKCYRPKVSPIFWALAATLAVLVLATIFSANPYRSFWSNYERMEGLIGHIHLFLYFLVSISVLKSEKDWKWLFHSSIFVSLLVGLYAVYQLAGKLEIHQGGDRVDATLGNATYFAIYLFFHLFIVLYYLLKSQQIGWKVLYGAIFVFEAFLLFYTATRGTILGFLGALLLFGLIQAFVAKEKKYRVTAFATIALVLILVSSFYFIKDTEFVRNSYTLSRFRGISLTDTTTQSRFILWGMALKGVSERPILGWGPENFNLIFSKHYDPRLWRQEPWFDRAHNVVLDWFTSGGILGLLAYLSIFGAALFVLWKKLWPRNKVLETSIFTAILAGYFFQNIFVFDNLISYFLFFSVLGFLHTRSTESETAEKATPIKQTPLHYMIPLVAAVVVLFSLYYVNVKPLMASRTLLNAIKIASAQDHNVDMVLSEFDKVFQLNTFGASEAREQLGGYVSNVIAQEIPNESKVKAFNKGVQALSDQVSENPNDPRSQLFLASLYLRAGGYDEALKLLDAARAISPRRQQFLFLAAEAYLQKNNYPEAIKLLSVAHEMDLSYPEAARNLAVIAIYGNQLQYAEEVLQQTYGQKIIADERVLNAYAQIGNYEKVKEIWLLLIQNQPQNAQYHVNLAATYVKLGQREEAIAELKKSIELNPEYKENAERLIGEIKSGKNP